MNPIVQDLLTARRMLREGASLMQAATETGMGRDDLDILLWRYAGRRTELPTHPRTPLWLASSGRGVG
jgi:hypothetical protein